MTSLSAVWDQILKFLNDGVSVIPVRDKNEELHNGKVFKKKTPYKSWEKFQTEIITKEELWFLMERFGTTAIATLCGEISGKLEAIDIDVKWEAGIDKAIFSEIKSMYPDLMPRLRIHKTPSGGWHIIYRVADGTIPGNKKLAMRDSTEEELKDDPKAKTKCFLETRGEGGYIVAPPSLDYRVVQQVPIPILTWQERENLINLCRSFNKVVKEEKTYTSSNADSIYYDVNPFEDFNKNDAGKEVLLNNGWTFYSDNERCMGFTRPGSKSGDLHAVFLYGSRLFRFFTTNCEFDNDRSYKPATVLGRLAFGGDMKMVYKHLVGRGFGQMKREIEKTILKKAVLSGGGELPSNISVEARQDYDQLLASAVKAHPYGTFWEFGERDAIVMVRERMYTVADGLGFRLYKGKLFQVEDKFVYERSSTYFFNTIKQYIQEEDGDLYINICSSYEAFVQKSGDFTITRMREIDRSELLFDTGEVCYKYFQNGYLIIDRDRIELQTYQTLNKLVFASRIQPRPYNPGEPGGKYMEFLNLACRYNDNAVYINSVIGYLSHEYKDSTTAYVIVLTEECPDPKMGGGSGKNVFCSLFSNTTTFVDVPGEQAKFDEKFLQAWNGEKIMVLSDVQKGFRYSFLKNLSSGNGKMKKLYKDESIIDVADMPKFLIQTNYGVDKVDGGMIRRIRQVEFTNYFTQRKGVDLHFGCMLPNGFDLEDWTGYDNLIAKAVQQWIAEGLKIGTIDLTAGGWIKQFEQTYGTNAREFFDEYFVQWVDEEKKTYWKKERFFVSLETFTSNYETFCKENTVPIAYRVSMTKLNKGLYDWCIHHNYILDVNWKDSLGAGVQVRGKSIFPAAPF